MIGKVWVSLALVLLVTSMIESAYDSKYDDVDIDGILENPKLRKKYVDCYFDPSRCVTPDMAHFGGLFGEAFVTKCSKCTDKQVEMLNKVTVWFTENDPESWKKIVEKAIDDMKEKNAEK